MTNRLLKYRIPARLIHWSMGFLFFWMIPVGFLMVRDGLNRSFQNFLLISHKNVGGLFLVLIIRRPIYRLFNPPTLNPVASSQAQEMATKVTYIGFYALLLIISLTGYVWIRTTGTR